MSFDQLIKFFQQLNETETIKQLKSDRLNLDNNNIMISESGNTDSDDHNHNSHNSDKNRL